MRDLDPVGYDSTLEALQLLVLRGDGLTTTSIETLTGREIGIHLQGQRRVRVTSVPDETTAYAGVMFDAEPPLAGAEHLATERGDELLVRRVHLTDAGGTVYGVGEVAAVLGRLPGDLVHTLLHTAVPLGKALAAHDVPVRREPVRWGRYPVGPLWAPLGVPDAAGSVLGRTYRMLATGDRTPLVVVTEWFAPRLFELAQGTAERMGRPLNPHRAARR